CQYKVKNRSKRCNKALVSQHFCDIDTDNRHCKTLGELWRCKDRDTIDEATRSSLM
ncbi:hypothetical protein J6590_092010, partial [Homalodisca vitripennis]